MGRLAGVARFSEPVARALRDAAPVVALESTVFAHGLPGPDNLATVRDIEQAVHANGAVPATIGMLAGELVIGLDDQGLARLAASDQVAKLSSRDLAVAAATGADGATTVAGTATVAAAAGIQVLATGGLGGVHRDATHSFDESADLVALARTPILVVCAGVKSILDAGATLERLETLGVAVVGYRTRRFPGFLVTDGGHDLDWSVGSPEQAARVVAAQRAQGLHRGAVVVANPVPADGQLDPARHDRVIAEGLAEVRRHGVTGQAVTPYLLGHLHAATGGESLRVNIRVLLRNAALAARIAAALAALPDP